MKDYDKHEIIHRLTRQGFTFKPHNAEPTYVEVNERVQIGIRLWGMLDFLNVNVIRVKGRPKSKRSRR